MSGETDAPTARDTTVSAIGLATLVAFFFSLNDVTANALTATLLAIQVAWLRYVVLCLVIVPTILTVRGGRALHTTRPKLQVVRALAVAVSSILFITGLEHLQVAEVTAINFISPIFITALSIPVLGEKVGICRWTAAVPALLGVMLIVQPGGMAFQFAALLPMGAALA
jgi:drug/metabolite transporter (DMT)-like permease